MARKFGRCTVSRRRRQQRLAGLPAAATLGLADDRRLGASADRHRAGVGRVDGCSTASAGPARTCAPATSDEDEHDP
jgi:hypothetical protein